MILYLGVFLVGILIGFLGGLFGKGGSAVATPMLSLIGIPGFVAVAAPLPATIPGLAIASAEYWRSRLIDWQIVRWSIAAGIPATILGSYLTNFTGSTPLLVVTGMLVLSSGLAFLLAPQEQRNGEDTGAGGVVRPAFWRLRLVLVATGVGLVSGLLANSGGFLLAPAYARILRQPLKAAFASSLAVSMVLAVPGTLIHAWLGHIDWIVTAVLAAGSVPFSWLGARTALRSRPARLERVYGIALVILGVLMFFHL